MKKNKFNYLKFATIILLVFSACTKDLKVNPVSVITVTSFWKTENDAVGALNGMYVQLKSMSETIFLAGEGRSEIHQIGPLGGAYTLSRNVLTPESPGISDWTGFYTIVNSANLILKYVPSIPFKSEDSKNNILAQAFTMRAYVYFVMTKTWGDLIIRTEPIESSDANITQKERSAKEEVFKFIKSDIEEAISLFSSNDFPEGRGFWTKPGANALKADVYLWTGKRLNGGTPDFNAALKACNEVAKADVALLPDFGDLFMYGNKGNKEDIMSIKYNEIDAQNNYFWFMWIIDVSIPSTIDAATNNLLRPTGAGQNLLVLTDLVRNQFTSDDTRKKASFVEIYSHDPQGQPSYYLSIPLKGSGIVTGGLRTFSSDIVVYRYAEVLLMKAEAENALGMDPSVEINSIRQRAYGGNYDSHVFVSGNQQQNDDAILKERLFELIYEGKRWWDLVRFDKAFELVPALQGRANDSYLLLFPIPTSVLNLESKVKQNPGY